MNVSTIPARIAVLATLIVASAPAVVSGASHGNMSDSADAMMNMEEGASMMRPDAHAPPGVTGADLMMPGKLMFSYRYMRMEMDDNRIGTDEASPEKIVTTVRNRFAPPPTLRVVPTEMTTEMHMLGAMYAPSERLTLMAMTAYIEKRMEHVTFRGANGTDRRGTFTTDSSGFGDTKLAGVLSLLERGGHEVYLNAGLSLPTGSIDESHEVLTPKGSRPTLRLPYPMQLGSGTFDLLPGVTYKGVEGRLGWGAQALATVRLGRNDEDYSLGERADLTVWGSYRWAPWVSTCVRLDGQHVGRVDGRDDDIAAPVQTADPAFQGGERVNLALGVNFAGQRGTLAGMRLGMELAVPVYQELNGPQMAADWSFSIGGEYMF